MGAIKNFFNNEINQENDILDDGYFFEKWQKKVEEEVMSWMNEQEENLKWDELFGIKQVNFFDANNYPAWRKV